MSDGRTHPAFRRYKRRLAGASALYVAAVGLAVWLIPDGAHAGPLTVGIALVPGLGVLGMIWAFARMLIELDDEYLRLLEVRKALAATGVVLAVASVWGLLELFTDVPRLPLFLIFPIWCLGLVAGIAWNKAAGV